jgi:trk system potassium uptake protein TrkA
MKVLVAGGGKVGYYLVKTLIDEGHEVSLVELDSSVCQTIAAELDVLIINGDATKPDILDDAGIQDADVVAAVTGKDEANLVICQLAKRKFGVPRTVARVNNPKNQRALELLGVDVAVSSTAVIAHFIEESMALYRWKTLLTFPRGNMHIVEVELDPHSPAIGKKVEDLNLPHDCVLVAVIRGEDVVIPRGNTFLEVGDEILAVTRSDVQYELVQRLTGKKPHGLRKENRVGGILRGRQQVN